MPNKPLKICNHPNCSELTSEAYCIKHKRQYDKLRGSYYDRGYDNRWRKYKILFLRECIRRNYIRWLDLERVATGWLDFLRQHGQHCKKGAAVCYVGVVGNESWRVLIFVVTYMPWGNQRFNRAQIAWNQRLLWF